MWYRIFSNGVWSLWVVGAVEKLVCLAPRFSLALPDDLRSPIRAEREELRNLHFFPPEYGGESLSRSQASDLLAHQTDQPCLAFPVPEVNDGTAVDIFSFGMCALEVLSTLLITSAPGSPSSCHSNLSLHPDGCTGDPSQWGYPSHRRGHCSSQALPE